MKVRLVTDSEKDYWDGLFRVYRVHGSWICVADEGFIDANRGAQDAPLLFRPVLEHALTTTHHWLTAEAQRIHRAGRWTRPIRSAASAAHFGLGVAIEVTLLDRSNDDYLCYHDQEIDYTSSWADLRL